ncbi:MAG TPA: thiamine phosphate synthase [Candidatus Acidoferrum sp.]
MRLVLPRLYVILDSSLLTTPVQDCAQDLAAAGVRLLQYRNKTGSVRTALADCRELVAAMKPLKVSVVMNDRADLAALCDADGVHVGQDDLSVEQVRGIVGKQKWVGVSTHNLEQIRTAAETSADYIAVGPIFGTTSKMNPDPVVGLELIREARRLTDKPIVAIGGITLERAASIIEAGANCVAVISDILRAEQPGKRAAEYVALLGAAGRSAKV